MINQHIRSFFGQNTGLIVKSISKSNNYIYLKCIKRKSNGKWEKLSKGEGKVIKCTLEEIIMILKVLTHQIPAWQSIHTYKDEKTTISFSWEENNNQNLWITIANYSKILNLAQVEILNLLLSHILNEKIIFATSPNTQKPHIIQLSPDSMVNSEKVSYKKEELGECSCSSEPDLIMNTMNSFQKDTLTKDRIIIRGFISGETKKALLINLKSEEKVWIPKSAVHSNYLPKKNLNQDFLIDNWILKRNVLSS